MGFRDELNVLSESFNSPKLENVKSILKKVASNGEKSTTLDSSLYDKWVVGWLKAQGIEAVEIQDQREGNFLRVSW